MGIDAGQRLIKNFDQTFTTPRLPSTFGVRYSLFVIRYSIFFWFGPSMAAGTSILTIVPCQMT